MNDEIDLGTDQYANLDPAIVVALEAFILGTDFEEALSRIDALQFLLAQWYEIEDALEARAWVDSHLGAPLILVRAADGDFEERAFGATDTQTSIPRQLLSSLESELLLVEDDPTRVIRQSSVEDIIANFTNLFVDQEKLLGHLVMAHDADCGLRRETADRRLNVHAELHLGQHPRRD